MIPSSPRNSICEQDSLPPREQETGSTMEKATYSIVPQCSLTIEDPLDPLQFASPKSCMAPFLSTPVSGCLIERPLETGELSATRVLDPTESFPSLLSWNIAGLAGKLKDPSWLKFVDDYNLICLQETWLTSIEAAFINGFQVLFQASTPSPAGRAS